MHAQNNYSTFEILQGRGWTIKLDFEVIALTYFTGTTCSTEALENRFWFVQSIIALIRRVCCLEDIIVSTKFCPCMIGEK